MIVLDASAVVDLLLDLPPHGEAVARRLAADPDGAAAPHLIDAEVGQVLRRFVLAGSVGSDRAVAAIEDLADLPLERFAHGPLLARAFALRENSTVYDALYLALAEALDAPLVTRDGALASVPGVRVRVEVLRSR